MKRLLLLSAALTALAFSACNKRGPALKLVGEDIPNFTKTEQTSPTQVIANGKLQESITLRDAKLSTVDDYAGWFAENGWSTLTTREDLSLLRNTYGKGEKQLMMEFEAGRGITLLGSMPEPKSK